jgi:hypothetical protein
MLREPIQSNQALFEHTLGPDDQAPGTIWGHSVWMLGVKSLAAGNTTCQQTASQFFTGSGNGVVAGDVATGAVRSTKKTGPSANKTATVYSRMADMLASGPAYEVRVLRIPELRRFEAFWLKPAAGASIESTDLFFPYVSYLDGVTQGQVITGAHLLPLITAAARRQVQQPTAGV